MKEPLLFTAWVTSNDYGLIQLKKLTIAFENVNSKKLILTYFRNSMFRVRDLSLVRVIQNTQFCSDQSKEE